jgi:hypothetical protein
MCSLLKRSLRYWQNFKSRVERLSWLHPQPDCDAESYSA